MKCSVDPVLHWAILCSITEILPTQQVHAASPCTFMTTACAIYWFLRQPLPCRCMNVMLPVKLPMWNYPMTKEWLWQYNYWLPFCHSQCHRCMVCPCMEWARSHPTSPTMPQCIKVLARKFPCTNQAWFECLQVFEGGYKSATRVQPHKLKPNYILSYIYKSSYRTNKNYWGPLMAVLKVSRQTLQQQRWQFRLQIEFEVNCTFVCIKSWSADVCVCVCVFMYAQFCNWLCMYGYYFSTWSVGLNPSCS